MNQFKTVADACDDIYYLDIEGREFPSGRKLPLRRIRAEHMPGYYDERVVMPKLLGGGDYGNSCFVEVANHKAFMERFGEHPDVIDLYGSYGSFGVAIRATCTDEEIIETLCSLEDYPCLDDELLAEVEQEAKDEAWENWICSDFEKKIKEAFDPNDATEDDFLYDKLSTLFYTLQDRCGEYLEPDGNGMYIRLENLIKVMEDDDFIDVLTPEDFKRWKADKENKDA